MKRSHDSLAAQIARLKNWINALGDVAACAPMQPPPATQHCDVMPCRPDEHHARRSVADNDDAELEDDVDYAPQHRLFDAHPTCVHCVQPHACDRVDHVFHVPVDDGGI